MTDMYQRQPLSSRLRIWDINLKNGAVCELQAHQLSGTVEHKLINAHFVRSIQSRKTQTSFIRDESTN